MVAFGKHGELWLDDAGTLITATQTPLEGWDPEVDGSTLVFQTTRNAAGTQEYSIYALDIGTSGSVPYRLSQQSSSLTSSSGYVNTTIDEGLAAWQQGSYGSRIQWRAIGTSSLTTFDAAVELGHGYYTQHPSVWNNPFERAVIAARTEKWDPNAGTVRMGVVTLDVDGSRFETVVDEAYPPPIASSSPSDPRSLVPHLAAGRLTYVKQNAIYYRDGVREHALADLDFKSFSAVYPEHQLQGLPVCGEYYYPRVGGTTGQYILWSGVDCEDGYRVLYLTNTNTGLTYFVTDGVGGRDVTDWSAVPYDIEENVIVYQVDNGQFPSVAIEVTMIDESQLVSLRAFGQ
ncbi:hypothetical protein [Vulgatibacter sp.]|uniref:hypothetical protein n=1 Tax=Vulgatibacter sp. TaxID=1971226 RepID=UPI003568EA5C